jgi:hypothetical protein
MSFQSILNRKTPIGILFLELSDHLVELFRLCLEAGVLLLMPETSHGVFSSFSSTVPASYANRRIIFGHCGMLGAEVLLVVSCFLAFVHTHPAKPLRPRFGKTDLFRFHICHVDF